jgi:hypothetical protein
MKPYGRNGNVRFHGKQDNTHNRFYANWWEFECDTEIDRGSINHRLRKIIDEAVDDHYNGYEDWLDKIDPFLCDCTLRPDIEFYQNRRDED